MEYEYIIPDDFNFNEYGSIRDYNEHSDDSRLLFALGLPGFGYGRFGYPYYGRYGFPYRRFYRRHYRPYWYGRYGYPWWHRRFGYGYGFGY